MEKLQIIKRHYNGDYGVGSIFEEKLSFEFNETLCNAHILKFFCCNEDLGSNILSTVDIIVPFILSNDNIVQLNKLLNKIENTNDYIYNESHYKKEGFDFNKFNYADIIINNNNYELSITNDIEILSEIENILQVKKLNNICNNTIVSINNMEDDING